METKIKALLISYVVGILPVYAERYSSGGEAFFVGALQGLFLMFVFWLWRVIKGGKSKKTEISKEASPSKASFESQPQLTPWEKYKRTNGQVATAIEMATKEDMLNLSEIDVYEKVATLKRMATHYNCPISEVKERTIKELLSKFDREELDDVLDKLEAKTEIESRQYSVAKGNTMSYYTCKWLKEYLQTNHVLK